MVEYIPAFIIPERVEPINQYLNSLDVNINKDVFYIDKIEEEHKDHREVLDKDIVKLVRELEQNIYQYLQTAYFPNRGFKIESKEWSRALELIRWQNGSELAAHADGSSDAPEWPIINIGCLIYLNDEYEGGEIKFNDYDLVYQPKIGDLVIFPNHYIHEVLRVKEKQPITRRHTMPVFYSFRIGQN
jgi:hypothetical protein